MSPKQESLPPVVCLRVIDKREYVGQICLSRVDVAHASTDYKILKEIIYGVLRFSTCTLFAVRHRHHSDSCL